MASVALALQSLTLQLRMANEKDLQSIRERKKEAQNTMFTSVEKKINLGTRRNTDSGASTGNRACERYELDI